MKKRVLKISAALSACAPISEETRAKMSAARTLYWKTVRLAEEGKSE